ELVFLEGTARKERRLAEVAGGHIDPDWRFALYLPDRRLDLETLLRRQLEHVALDAVSRHQKSKSHAPAAECSRESHHLPDLVAILRGDDHVESKAEAGEEADACGLHHLTIGTAAAQTV